jgi:2-dehydro-3-deoxygalactonokinase
VLLLSGVRSGTDVMRGEETEALGLRQYLGCHDEGPAVWILPGTHSKHLLIERGNIVEFATYMTGELFDVLCTSSVLRHVTQSAASDERSTAVETSGDFQAGLDEGRTMPLTNALFHVRTRAVLNGTSGPANAAFLSGLLIGAEIAAVERNHPQVAQIVLCAAAKLAEPYQRALTRFGLAARSVVVPADVVATLSIRGQCVALERHASKLPRG